MLVIPSFIVCYEILTGLLHQVWAIAFYNLQRIVLAVFQHHVQGYCQDINSCILNKLILILTETPICSGPTPLDLHVYSPDFCQYM